MLLPTQASKSVMSSDTKEMFLKLIKAVNADSLSEAVRDTWRSFLFSFGYLSVTDHKLSALNYSQEAERHINTIIETNNVQPLENIVEELTKFRTILEQEQEKTVEVDELSSRPRPN